MERAVCLPSLKGSHFTTGAVDNIDHDPSSTSTHDSFHGTGISLFQHPDTNISEVHRVVFTMPDDMATKGTIAWLPETYTSIPLYLPDKIHLCQVQAEQSVSLYHKQWRRSIGKTIL